MDFLEPGVDAIEGLRVGEIVDVDDAECVFIVGSGDGSEAFLSGLGKRRDTVSHICILMVEPSTLTFLVANSTPMVGLLSAMKESLMNLLRMVDFPTEVSPMRMYFMM